MIFYSNVGHQVGPTWDDLTKMTLLYVLVLKTESYHIFMESFRFGREKTGRTIDTWVSLTFSPFLNLSADRMYGNRTMKVITSG